MLKYLTVSNLLGPLVHPVTPTCIFAIPGPLLEDGVPVSRSANNLIESNSKS